MNYLPLLMISLKHTFYDSGNCPDFSVTAKAETVRLLHNHRCVIKPNAYGLSVYVPVDRLTPLIAFDKKDQFFFDLNLNADQFALYTDNQKVDHSGSEGFTVYQAKNSVKSGQAILLKPPSARDPLLSIAIQRDFSQIKATPSTDEILFKAKPVLWFYYVVTDQSKIDNKSLTIEDVGKETPKTTWTQLIPLTNTNDSIYAQLNQQFPGKTIACFISDQTLACQQSCTRQLKLKQDGHSIFEQLPGPSYRNHFRMEANKGSNPSDAIYEIVKYFTNTPSIKG